MPRVLLVKSTGLVKIFLEVFYEMQVLFLLKLLLLGLSYIFLSLFFTYLFAWQ